MKTSVLNKVLIVFFILSCAVAYFFLIRQYIPTVDDMHYKFVFGGNDTIMTEGHEPINSIAYIWRSQVWHYQYATNGRFFCQFVVQLLIFFGNNVFFVVSSIVFSLFIYLLYIISSRNRSIVYLPLIFLLVAYLVPHIGHTFITSVSFTVNYLFAATLNLFFLYAYIKFKDKDENISLWKVLLMSAFAIIVGGWHEGFSIGIAGAIGIDILVNIKKTNRNTWFLAIGYALGVLVLLFSPANLSHAGAQSGGHLGQAGMSLYQITQILKHEWSVISFLLISFVSMVYDITKYHKIVFLWDNRLFSLSGLITILFMVLLAFNGVYQFVWVSVCSVVLIVGFIEQMLCETKFKRTVCIYICMYVCMYVCMGVGYGFVWKDRQQLYCAYKVFENRILRDRPQVGIYKELEIVNRNIISDKWTRRFTHFAFWPPSFYLSGGIAAYLTNGDNSFCNQLCEVSQDEVNEICSLTNPIANNIWAVEEIRDYYILRLPNTADDVQFYELTTSSKDVVNKLKDKIRQRDVHKDIHHCSKMYKDDEYNYYIIEPVSLLRNNFVAITYMSNEK